MFVFFVSSRLKEAKTETTPGDELREKVRKWLSPPDPSINHNTAREACHDGTATWFLEGITYNEWKATGSLLWTHGNRTAFPRVSSHLADDLFCSWIWQKHSLVGITYQH